MSPTTGRTSMKLDCSAGASVSFVSVLTLAPPAGQSFHYCTTVCIDIHGSQSMHCIPMTLVNMYFSSCNEQVDNSWFG